MSDTDPGTRLLRLGWEVTVGFGLLTVLTHAVADALDLAYAIVSSALFVMGIGLFGLGFWNGVQRSRTELVTLSGLLAASRSNVPASALRLLWGAVLAQAVIGGVAAGLRPFTQQAFGLLVPMFGVGLAAVWGSRHGRFHLRDDP